MAQYCTPPKYSKVPLTAAILLGALLLSACSRAGAPPTEKPLYLTSIFPLAAVLSELAGDRAEVRAVAPPGASPHTFQARPQDVKDAERAEALFLVGAQLDNWAERMPAREHVTVFEMLPAAHQRKICDADCGTIVDCAGHDHDYDHDHTHSHDHAHDHEHGDCEDYDPHFWLDPNAVAALLPALTDKLIALDPKGAALYRRNADQLSVRLAALDAEIDATLAPLAGTPLLQLHPSAGYFFARYELECAGVVHVAPGRNPSSRELRELTQVATERNARAVLAEPQLSDRAAKVLARELDLPVLEFDPVGGAADRTDYEGLLRYNARALGRLKS